MNLKKVFLAPIIVSLCACSGQKNFSKYTFMHQQAVSDYSDYMYYDDSIFDSDANIFNPQLASASIAFSMASFASMEEKKYANKSKNANELLTKLGFTDFETNQWFKEKPGADTIGVLAAKKKIGDYTVVAIGLRGAAYFSEWASNFTLGNREDGFHEGFRTAADNCISFAKEYFATKNIQGNVKIWISGYSRAGATSNIAAGLIDEDLNKGLKPFGENINLTRNHLYAYCFEAPQGAPNILNDEGHIKVKTNDFDNIFNILNVNDPVPLVAMHELGFTRYGRDMYLPDPLFSFDYEQHFGNMLELYYKASNHEAIGDYVIDNFTFKGLSSGHSMTQGLFLREFIADLTLEGISHRGAIDEDEYLSFYASNVQTGLRNLFKTLYESEAFKGSLMDLGIAMVTDLGIIDEIDTLISDLVVEGTQAFINDFRPILTKGLNSLNLEVDVKQTVDELIEFIKIIGHEMTAAMINAKSYELLSWFNKNNIKAIASGHYPELCAAHVRALDDNYVDNPYKDYDKMDGQYYSLFVDDGNISIIIENNKNVIVNINNGEEIDNEVAYYKRFGGYQIYLPYHESYTVKLGDNVDFALSYYSNEYQEYIDVEKSLDLNNSFAI